MSKHLHVKLRRTKLLHSMKHVAIPQRQPQNPTTLLKTTNPKTSSSPAPLLHHPHTPIARASLELSTRHQNQSSLLLPETTPARRSSCHPRRTQDRSGRQCIIISDIPVVIQRSFYDTRYSIPDSVLTIVFHSPLCHTLSSFALYYCTTYGNSLVMSLSLLAGLTFVQSLSFSLQDTSWLAHLRRLILICSSHLVKSIISQINHTMSSPLRFNNQVRNFTHVNCQVLVVATSKADHQPVPT